MTKVSHTPGPWAIGASWPESRWIDVVSTTDPRLLPFVSCRHHDEEANAARIVACVNACEGINPEAVPDLLASLQELLELHIAHHNNPAHVSARAAIAKARGQ